MTNSTIAENGSGNTVIVYLDVGNTLSTGFITGIQRTTRELSKQLTREQPGDFRFRFYPILFDSRLAEWRHLTSGEIARLRDSIPRLPNLLIKIYNRIAHCFPWRKKISISNFEPGSIFIDMDNTWHGNHLNDQVLNEFVTKGVKTVRIQYDLIPLLHPQSIPLATQTSFAAHFHAHINAGSLFLCISHTTQNDLVKYCQRNELPIPRNGVIRLGADFTITNAHPPTAVSSRLLSEKFILVVGTIEPRKNHKLILDAFTSVSKHHDVHLIIVGREGWMCSDTIKQLRDHPLFDEKVHWFQNITDGQLCYLYQNAWLNVIASSYEGFGLPLIEALSHGCPTLASNIPVLKEIGGTHVQYFNLHDSSILSAALDDLLKPTQQYSDLKRRALLFKPAQWSDGKDDVLENLIDI